MCAKELAHLEMIAAIVYQLTRNLTPEQIKEGGYDSYFVDHTTGIYPQGANGMPWSAAGIQSKGDPITDLFEDLAAEQKARTTYDNLLRLIDDPDVRDPIKFLRAREVVHFQRFGDALRIVQDNLDAKNYYAYNPAFDVRPPEAPSPTPRVFVPPAITPPSTPSMPNTSSTRTPPASTQPPNATPTPAQNRVCMTNTPSSPTQTRPITPQ